MSRRAPDVELVHIAVVAGWECPKCHRLLVTNKEIRMGMHPSTIEFVDHNCKKGWTRRARMPVQ